VCLPFVPDYILYFILLWHDIACLCWKCRWTPINNQPTFAGGFVLYVSVGEKKEKLILQMSRLMQNPASICQWHNPLAAFVAVLPYLEPATVRQHFQEVVEIVTDWIENRLRSSVKSYEYTVGKTWLMETVTSDPHTEGGRMPRNICSNYVIFVLK